MKILTFSFTVSFCILLFFSGCAKKETETPPVVVSPETASSDNSYPDSPYTQTLPESANPASRDQSAGGAEKASSADASSTVFHNGRFEKLPAFGINIGEISPENYVKIDVHAMQAMGMQKHYVLYLSGNKLYKAGDYEKAIAEYTKVIDLKNDYTNAWVSRGNAYCRKKDYSRAIEDYSRALRQRPDYAEAYNYRGYAWAEKGEIIRAIEDYTQALRYKAVYADAYYNRGDAYAELKEYEKAIQDYSRLLELEQRNATAYNRRGGVWYNMHRDDEAMKDFNMAIKLQPANAVYYHNRGSLWCSKGNFDEALEDFNQALRLDPGYTAASYSLDRVLKITSKKQ